MTQSNGVKRQTRALQERTGWSYSECRRCVMELTAEQIEKLIAARTARKDPA